MSDAGVTIKKLWICPPLAFARFGELDEPMVNFHWAPNDYQPRGTAETEVLPTTTFRVEADGTLSAFLPESIEFRQEGKWRPVAPFFELHGRTSDGEEGPITEARLKACGLGLADVSWRVHAANLKAHHYTLQPGDRVDACVDIQGDAHDRVALSGKSPEGADNPIVSGDPLPLGAAQVIRPNPAFPELRLRITPPKGLIYAPTNTASRDLSALVPNEYKRPEFLQRIHQTLNPNSAWASWQPKDGDSRTNPGGLYAQEPDAVSLGFLDDSSDGLITVRVGRADDPQPPMAYARFTCCPQDFQPDRRPFRSIADGLSDLVSREEVSQPAFLEGTRWTETEMEIADFMQRVRETMEASNLDHQNLRSKLANEGITQINPDYPFDPQPPRPGHPLPLTETGRANHARFLAYDVFRQRLAQRPDLFDKWIRNPAGEPTVYDNQMPAVMRGSDSYPMTITQRQYNLLKAWLNKVAS